MPPDFIFLHIGKTGGSSIKNAVSRHETQTGEKLAKFLAHNESLPDLLASGRPGAICFNVRDPVKRYVSGFNSRLRRGRLGNRDWSHHEEKIFSRFPDANALAEALNSSCDVERRQARRGIRRSTHIMRGLTHYLGSVEMLELARDRIAFIGHLPTLDDDYKVFQQLTGILPEIELSTDDTVAHRMPTSQAATLSSVGEDNIRAWYADDYPIYEWCLRHRLELLQRHGQPPSA